MQQPYLSCNCRAFDMPWHELTSNSNTNTVMMCFMTAWGNYCRIHEFEIYCDIIIAVNFCCQLRTKTFLCSTNFPHFGHQAQIYLNFQFYKNQLQLKFTCKKRGSDSNLKLRARRGTKSLHYYSPLGYIPYYRSILCYPVLMNFIRNPLYHCLDHFGSEFDVNQW